MWLLYLLLLLVLYFALIYRAQTDRSVKKYILVLFSILGVLMMFRSQLVGNDTLTYVNLFNLIKNTNNVWLFSSRYETGYVLLNKALGYISDNPQILLITTGFFTAFSFGRFIYRQSSLPWLSVYMFLTLQFFDMAMSGIRQIVAVSILLYAYEHLLNRKFWKFIAIVLMASTIHSSSIMYIVLYPLTKIKCSKRFIAWGSLIAVTTFLAFSYIILIVGRLFPSYLKYFTDSESSFSTGPKLALGIMLTLWALLFTIGYTINIHNQNKIYIGGNVSIRMSVIQDDNTINIQAIGVFISIVMLLWSLQGTILERFKFIYAALLLAYYPNALNKIKDRKVRLLLIVISCAVFTAYITIIYVFRPEWQSTYPYSFFIESM